MTNCPKCKELARLLLEARDALPAISQVSARLRNIDLSLADRIERALEPWRISEPHEGNEGGTMQPGSCAHCGQFHSSAACPPEEVLAHRQEEPDMGGEFPGDAFQCGRQ